MEIDRTPEAASPEPGFAPRSLDGVVGCVAPASFVFSMSRAYRDLQTEIEMAVATGDPNALQRVLAAAPFNPDGLVRLADYCRHTGQNELASECVAKALHASEVRHTPFHDLAFARPLVFPILQGIYCNKGSEVRSKPIHYLAFA